MNVETPEQALIAQQDAATLRQALQRLPARHERVLRLWYGIGCEPMTFKQIGEQLGVVGARAQQMAREAERRLRMPLMPKFRERLGARRLRREINEAWQAMLRAQEFAHEQHIINEERAAEQRRLDMVEVELQRIEQEKARVARRETERAQAEHERQRKHTVVEILRIAEEVELELDQIPRQRKQRLVNPFGFSAERAAEYAEVLRALTLPHYRMRT